MIYLPSIVSVGYYFEKKRPMATGIAVCGSGIGTFIFSPLLEYLSEVYDWKNLLFIMAGVILNGAVFGMLMRPLNAGAGQKASNGSSDSDLSSDSGIKVEKKKIEVQATVKSEEGNNKQNESRYSVKEETVTEDGIHLMEIEPFIQKVDLPSDNKPPCKLSQRRSSSLNDLASFQKSRHTNLRVKPVNQHQIIYSGSLLNIPPFHSHPNIVHSMFSIHSAYANRKTVWDRCTCLPSSVVDILREMLDFSLLLNIPFLVLCIGNIFACVGFFIPFYFLVDRALLLNIPNTQAAFLLSIIGKQLTGKGKNSTISAKAFKVT